MDAPREQFQRGRLPYAGVFLALGAGLGAAAGVFFGSTRVLWGVVGGAAVGNAVGAVVDWILARPEHIENVRRKESLS